MLAQEKYTTTADNLFAASQMMPVVADAMTVKASQGALKRGALLDATGTLCTVNAGKTTVSEVYAVLAETLIRRRALLRPPFISPVNSTKTLSASSLTTMPS